ncbi:MAG: hypothetical protein QM813_09430 [Verrucomicrobiota bacterium]
MSNDFNGHQNGNGSGHGIFGLVAKTDPDTLAVLVARRACRADSRLTRSMKSCFDEIADRCLNPQFYDVKGVATISDTILAEIYAVSCRTIYTWKQRIAECGYLWITKKPKTNMWPLTTYHLTCLHRPMRQQRTDADGTYGGGKFRSAPANPGLGARRPGQASLPLPGSRQVAPPSEKQDLQAISAESRNFIPLSPEDSFGSEPKLVSAESRSEVRAAPEAVIGSEPKPSSAESRNLPPPSAEVGFRHIKAKAIDSGTQLGGKGDSDASSPPDLELEKFKNRLNGMFDSKLVTLEKELRGKLDSAKTPASREHWKVRLAAVKAHRLGGLPPDETVGAKPVRTSTGTNAPKPMPLDQRQKLWSAAKKSISPEPVAAGA